jgi:hypothetical protein
MTCRFRKHIPGTQFWHRIDEREGDGCWLKLRTHCIRCGANLEVGALFMSRYEARQILDRAAIAKATKASADEGGV